MSWFASFDAAKLRLKLKIAATRITLTINNKTNEIKKQKQEIANLLKTGNKQIEFARIRTEHLVREDWNVEVLEIIGLLAALVQVKKKAKAFNISLFGCFFRSSNNNNTNKMNYYIYRNERNY